MRHAILAPIVFLVLAALVATPAFSDPQPREAAPAKPKIVQPIRVAPRIVIPTDAVSFGFGFRYHSGIVRSILSPAHGEEDFTHWDELMLTTLYNDRLTPGSSRAEALASVRTQINVALTE